MARRFVFTYYTKEQGQYFDMCYCDILVTVLSQFAQFNTIPPGIDSSFGDSASDSESDSESVSSWQPYSPITSESEHEHSELSDTECSYSDSDMTDEFEDQEQNITDQKEADFSSTSLQCVAFIQINWRLH